MSRASFISLIGQSPESLLTPHQCLQHSPSHLQRRVH
jgi:hypothetical protein